MRSDGGRGVHETANEAGDCRCRHPGARDRLPELRPGFAPKPALRLPRFRLRAATCREAARHAPCLRCPCPRSVAAARRRSS